ncbi:MULTISPECIES: DUF6346 domain-containing protein [unclassified Micromonospora]|uniref:DUF6346 domain-containing protein n=1 Tax=unclassified Micromonospora TaxID=2617518 RepID=UPI00098D48A9|nr:MULTISPECIES: DUF6346 domain-containing protein [unclassified Micromonospora]MDI5937294.1 DUF6346 domain-containing protein [Micromonospora sp. DH15]OON31094.1 hypothetical protein BSA16_12750 [Micromonospora sp. Rc5]
MSRTSPEETAAIQREQIAAYERRGPFWGRLTQLGVAVACAVAIVVSWLVFNTMTGFYSGTGMVKSTPAERPAQATVGECRRVGPVSGDGFGYWWQCAVTVRTGDGREVRIVTRNSAVTPADRGGPVDFREACFGKGNTDCRYGRPVSRVWALAVTILGMVRVALTIMLILGVWYSLLRSVLGVPRYYARLNRREARRNRVVPLPVILTKRPDPYPGPTSPCLRITFTCPDGPFAELYRSTGPRLLLAGVEVSVPGWGSHEFAVPAGPSSVRVVVPFGGTDDFAVAEHEVTVGVGETVELEYVAPTVLGLSGRIRVTGHTG